MGESNKSNLVGFATLNEAGAVIEGSTFDLRPSEDTLGKYSCLLLLDNHSSRFVSYRYGTGLLLQSKRMPGEALDTYMCNLTRVANQLLFRSIEISILKFVRRC
jgi:hypothetical protein